MNFQPVFELGIFYKDRSGFEDKLGGLPFGFPIGKWPKCTECEENQNYIGQFHHSDKVNLKKKGNVLYLFQCQNGGMCSTWDPRSGANAAIIIDSEEFTGVITQAPPDTEIEPEAIITRWEEIKPSIAISYVGGNPSFGCNHVKEWESDGQFLIQLISSIQFDAPAPSPEQTGAEHLYYSGGEYGMDDVRIVQPPVERSHFGEWSRGQTKTLGQPSQVSIFENGKWSVECANFGGGTAYVYLDQSGENAFYFWEK